MRIIIATGIFAPDIGGPASYAKTLGTRLAAEHDVVVVTYSDVRRHASDVDLPFAVERVWRKTPRGLRHLLYLWRLYGIAKGADVILALNAVSAGYPASLVAKWRKTRFVVKIVGDAAWEWAVNSGATYLMINDFQKVEHSGRAGRLHKRQVQVCRAANRIIVPSRYLAGLVQGWGIESERVAVVYNGSDFEPVEMEREAARKAIGVAGNIILSVGRLVPWKGFRMLIKVMPQLLQLNQFTRLVIVGDGPLAGDLKAMARTLGLERKVFVVGPKSRDELRTYLAAADLFALNTGYEGFSHQLLEALRAGVPVVTTTAGGNRELITQGETGFMVKYNDEFNLVEAIKMLWSNEQIRRKFITNGRKAAEQFSVERMLSETEQILLTPNI